MTHTASPLGQFPASIPATTDAPDVQTDLKNLIGMVELQSILTFASRSARTSAFTAASISPVDGMRSYIQDVDEIDDRINGAWVKTWPVIYSGTSAPSNSLGIAGDLYIQYT